MPYDSHWGGTPYKTRAWKRRRVEILDRDGHQCQIRSSGCLGEATHVDHVVPWRDGGDVYDPANLRAACSFCNTSAGTHHKNANGWRRNDDLTITVYVGPVAEVHDWVSTSNVLDHELLARDLGGGGLGSALASLTLKHLLHQLRRGDIDSPGEVVLGVRVAEDAVDLPYHRIVGPGVDDGKRGESFGVVESGRW